MIAQFSIFPLGKGVSIREHVASAVRAIQDSGLDYRVTAMGTILEGDWDSVMNALKAARDEVLSRTDRVYMTVAIDDRTDKEMHIDSKMQALEAEIGVKLS